jgi:hypothetical protein
LALIGRRPRGLQWDDPLRRADGEGLVDLAEPPGHVAGEVEQHDGILIGHLPEEMMERSGLDLNGAHLRQRADRGGARHGFDDAHFAEKVALAQRGQRDRVRAIGMLDDFDVALNEDEEGVALVALADDPRAGGEIVHDAFLRKEGLRRRVDSRQDGNGCQGVEKRGSGCDHLRKAVTELPNFLDERNSFEAAVALHVTAASKIPPTSSTSSRSRALSYGLMKGVAPILGWVAIGLALLVSFGVDFANTAQGGAIDLRNRITGLRLLEHGIDAYHYKWHDGDPEAYCDVYNNPKLPVSKTTATPALLMLHVPWAALPYRLAQFLWFFAQWLLLLGTGWLWLRACPTSRQRWLVALAVTGFTYTAAWRLHAERGQAYVLLAFLFACWLTATLDPKRGNGFVVGCIAGFLIALRPPFVLLVPFLAWHRRGQLVGAAVGLALGFGLPLLMNPAGWTDYFSAMRTHSELYRNAIDPRPGPQSYPPTVEGIPTDTLGNYVAIPYADFSVFALLRWLGFAPFPAAPVVLAVAMLLALWIGLSRKQPAEHLLPGLAAWFFLIDLFLPAYRDSYNDVLILNVVALGFVTAAKFPWAAWPCALALPLGWAVYAFGPEQAWLINLPTALFTLGAILFLFLPIFRQARGNRT